jgi:hypothetical protein
MANYRYREWQQQQKQGVASVSYQYFFQRNRCSSKASPDITEATEEDNETLHSSNSSAHIIMILT